jgi:translation initiation factor IF-3
MIRISPVRVVDENATQLGVMPTAQALSMAQERGYDLVEVAPMASPPVVRFLDFGQYKYELAKREKEAKRRSRSVEFKEVRLRPKIGGGDFETKVHRAIEFLSDGDRIKVTVQFRGRELTHPEIGRNLLNRFADAIKDHGTVDRAPSLEGRSMSMTVTSTHKPKTHEAGKPAHAEDAPGSEGTAPAAAAPSGATAPPPPGETAPKATGPTAPKAAAAAAANPAATPDPTPAPAPAGNASENDAGPSTGDGNDNEAVVAPTGRSRPAPAARGAGSAAPAPAAAGD